MFIFAVGNGLCEAVVNPMTATLFPKNKTHYLNILHAGWPAGLVLGGLASFFMAATTNEAGEVIAKAVDWKIQMSLFLVPVVLYGVMLFGQKFSKVRSRVSWYNYPRDAFHVGCTSHDRFAHHSRDGRLRRAWN